MIDITEATKEVKDALIKLGYGVYGHNVGVHRVMYSITSWIERKLKKLCKRSWSIDLTYRIKKINEVTRGWVNYFRIGSMKAKLQRMDEHLRTMIRVIIWKQWKTCYVWGEFGVKLLKNSPHSTNLLKKQNT